MTSTVSDPPSASTEDPSSARRLQAAMTAARLSITWLGVRKSLTRQQKELAANPFGAEGRYLSAGKKLLDTSHPTFRAVTGVRGRAVNYWKAVSLPYPEPGIRLIRRNRINEFRDRMEEYREELQEAVTALNQEFRNLQQMARRRLGNLFCAGDYPETLEAAFDIECDFPSVEPPEYLRRLNPELYDSECQRMQQRFSEAVQLAESAFLDELSKLVEHLTERLSGTDDGQPKVFRDSAVNNLQEFFQRFQSLNIHSSDQLDQLVDQVRGLVSGVRPQQLRSSSSLRQQIAGGLSGVQAHLDQLMVDRPRRSILRRPR